MRAAWTIAKRELRAFFVAPLAYVVLTVWMLWSGLAYYMYVYWFATQASTARQRQPADHVLRRHDLLLRAAPGLRAGH